MKYSWPLMVLPIMIAGCTPPDQSSNKDKAATAPASGDQAKTGSDAPAKEEPAPQTGQPAKHVFSGKVTGNDHVDHRFSANKGQQISVTIDQSGNPYFNLMAPDSAQGEALFTGMMASDPTKWSGAAPTSGEYVVRVYLRGNAKDAKETRDYRIEAEVT